jgi:ParB family chromosome partitioning protein
MVEVGLVSANPWQPRQRFDEGSLEGLADSIRRSGLMQPIVVRPAPADEATGGRVGYELVAGERRWRAAQIAGLERVPAVVRRLSDVEAAEWALVENLEREDLNPIEQGWALRRLMERFGLTQAQVAERVGLERSSVANLVRLTELDEETAGLVASGRLSAGHAKVLLSVTDGPARASLARRAVREDWSVRRTEREVGALLAASARRMPLPERYVSPAGADLERRLSEHLGTRVRIATDRSGKSGRVIIEFYGLDQLDGVLEKVGVKR